LAERALAENNYELLIQVLRSRPMGPNE